jgi:hypothetical protein
MGAARFVRTYQRGFARAIGLVMPTVVKMYIEYTINAELNVSNVLL